MKPIIRGPICRATRPSDADRAEARKERMASQRPPFRQDNHVQAGPEGAR